MNEDTPTAGATRGGKSSGWAARCGTFGAQGSDGGVDGTTGGENAEWMGLTLQAVETLASHRPLRTCLFAIGQRRSPFPAAHEQR